MNNMRFIIKHCVALLSLFAWACGGETVTQESHNPTTETDSSIKLFFYNFDKKRCDSIYCAIKEQNKHLNVIEVDVDTLFKKLSGKMTLTYDHYSFYAKEMALKGSHKKALALIMEGEKLPHKKSQAAFDKALVWGGMLPLGKRDILYKYLDEAVYFDSMNPYYIRARSQFYKEDSLFDKALIDVNKAIQLAPHDTELVNLRGSYKNAMKDYKGALEDLKYIASNHLNDADIYEQRAFAYGKLEMYKEAYNDINRSIALNPSIAKSYGIRAVTRYKLFNDHDGAIEDMRKGAALGDPEAITYMQKYDEYQKTHKKM